MAGNVWEWCLNEYDEPELIIIYEFNAVRVLRGGSWMRSQNNARCSCRLADRSFSRHAYYGFRVARSGRHRLRVIVYPRVGEARLLFL
jgi:formylglycine-generating enzyme required for sulfatase activity